MPDISIDDFSKSIFTANSAEARPITHDIYQLGSGAPVVIIQELPGIGQETLSLAQKFVDQGFSVYLPHLFGPIGKISMAGNVARVFCMRKEFHLFSANKTSPIVDWLKALCQKIKTDTDTQGVGVIGMCLTGNFAISLMADDSVLAAVAAQPSMPIAKQTALHMSSDDISQIKQGIDCSEGMYAYRFEHDPICKAAKFAALDAEFNQQTSRINLVTLPGKGHSVLTVDFIDKEGHPTRQALDQIFGYFSRQLN
ncbi:MAG: dienelactone hydrolase [Porticoccus sp.]|jgi:dienelactone hydrolase